MQYHDVKCEKGNANQQFQNLPRERNDGNQLISFAEMPVCLWITINCSRCCMHIAFAVATTFPLVAHNCAVQRKHYLNFDISCASYSNVVVHGTILPWQLSVHRRMHISWDTISWPGGHGHEFRGSVAVGWFRAHTGTNSCTNSCTNPCIEFSCTDGHEFVYEFVHEFVYICPRMQSGTNSCPIPLEFSCNWFRAWIPWNNFVATEFHGIPCTN